MQLKSLHQLCRAGYHVDNIYISTLAHECNIDRGCARCTTTQVSIKQMIYPRL